ncbi:MAG: Zn-ribbon domain-containing OB-fold protein [Chloroflexi bacterium]|nr:Zn-ribbon domain-containing OB-fold protein [Chloroflexota bacterium]
MDMPRHWRLKDQRYNLVGTECLSCGAKQFPPRPVCPDCHSKEVQPLTFSGQGEVYSYSTVFQAPLGYEEFIPYTVALVKLKEGPLVTAQLTDVDNDEVRIGMKIEMVTRKLREYGEDGVIVYGYKFRPIGWY